MLSRCYSASVCGLEASIVEVEVNTGQGLPQVIIVGLPDKAVTESRDRVKTALENSAFRHVRTRTTINLAPANLKKEGPIYDLPMALCILAATEQVLMPRLADFLIVGELALNGAIRPIRGVLSIAMLATTAQKTGVLVPYENASEAALVQNIEVYGISNLRQCAEFLSGKEPLPKKNENLAQLFSNNEKHSLDFADVKGQQHAKRALEVAVAGGHNILLVGPPGSGKSMLAKRIVTIAPPMCLEESLETTRIHSAAGNLKFNQSIIATRPFRAPHHTVSDVALTGGTSDLRPGEISLAHHGVLFLDELPEFRRTSLEALRQPLEDGTVQVTRANGSVLFPCRFMLVAAMNPCPCGYYGDPRKECRCSPSQIQKYRAKISGPLLDRIDLHVEVPSVQYHDLISKEAVESSESIRNRIIKIREIQRKRFKKNGRLNAYLSTKGVRAHCALDDSCHQYLKAVMHEMHFSMRAYDRILKVARTIADLENKSAIDPNHLGEALQYRSLDRNLWT